MLATFHPSFANASYVQRRAASDDGRSVHRLKLAEVLKAEQLAAARRAMDQRTSRRATALSHALADGSVLHAGKVRRQPLTPTEVRRRQMALLGDAAR